MIKQAVPLLAAMDYTELQLTLDQHGIYTYNFADPDRDSEPETAEEYCTARLGQANDTQLVQLAEYVASTSAARPAPTGQSPWAPGALARVFISHVSEDAVFASSLSSTLNTFYATDGFVAHRHIVPSQPWREQIKHGLATCDALVAILHERFHASEWCDQEVGWALGRGVPVLPVRPRPDLPRRDGFLGERQDCPLDPSRGDPAFWICRQTVTALVQHTSSARVGINVTVRLLEQANSYADAKWAWNLLATRPEITIDQARRLVTAATDNSQVRDAYTDDKRHQIAALIHRLCDPIISEADQPTPPPF